MVAGAFLVVLFVVIGLGGGLLLYVLVRAEHDGRQVMQRGEAERVARRDTTDEDR